MSTRVFLLMMLLGGRYLVAQAIPATGYGGEDIYKTFISGEYYIILFIIIMHIIYNDHSSGTICRYLLLA